MSAAAAGYCAVALRCAVAIPWARGCSHRTAWRYVGRLRVAGCQRISRGAKAPVPRRSLATVLHLLRRAPGARCYWRSVTRLASNCELALRRASDELDPPRREGDHLQQQPPVPPPLN